MCLLCGEFGRPQAAEYHYGTAAAHARVLLYRLRVNEKDRGLALVALSGKGARSGVAHTDCKRKPVRGFPLTFLLTPITKFTHFLRALDNVVHVSLCMNADLL